MMFGKREIKIGEKCLVMGILNVTPDSFSDGGKFNAVEKAVEHAKEMIEQGADIIDIGGESTRPGSQKVLEDEEIQRVVPVIEALSKVIDVPISIDTYKGRVAELAIEAGATMINDVWGFKKDPYMAEVAAKYDVPCCLMHNRDNTEYENLMEEVKCELSECIEIALNAGVKKENIILDPGIGFGKTVEQNLQVMKSLEEICEMGYPVLLGTSRKSMIGKTLDLPVDQRVEGTIATTVMGVMAGCDFVRVHDIKENLRALRMTEAILNS